MSALSSIIYPFFVLIQSYKEFWKSYVVKMFKPTRVLQEEAPYLPQGSLHAALLGPQSGRAD